MTALAWTLLALVWSSLMVFAFVVGERFERDRWLEALNRVARDTTTPRGFEGEINYLRAKVCNDGWSDAP